MGKIPLYGVLFYDTVEPVQREIECIRRGGQWTKSDGTTAGMGLFFHYKRLQQLLWPHKKWHRWNELELQAYIDFRIIGEIGPASSGKTCSAATNGLADYYCFPECTTILVSSTEKEMLEMRIWGEIKAFHRAAKAEFPWLPGNLIEGRQRIITSNYDEIRDGRDFRNGLCGVPCKRGGNYQGLGSYVGIKNARVRLLADEGHLMPRVYVDAISNLNKNPDFKAVVLGNPKETTDALGIVCEPASHLGGWDGGIDQQPGTKVWETRFHLGVCLQLPGSDSPNLDGKLGIPLITQEQIDADIKFYGKDSLQYTMMNEGRMPRGQGSRRVITRQLCLKFMAMEKPIWKDAQKITKLAFLDASYRGTGGDRCIYGELDFGEDTEGRNIIALVDTTLVPISVETKELPEDQIAVYVQNQNALRGILPENTFFDSTGRGSLMGAFARLYSANVVPVEFGGPPSERKVSDEIDIPCKEYYYNFVSELWYGVRNVIESGQFRGMTEDVMQEGCMREWTIVSGNKIQVEPKDKMKVKTGRSPDLFDGLVVGVEGARRRGFIIARMTSVGQNTSDLWWRRRLRQRAQDFWKKKDLNYAA